MAFRLKSHETLDKGIWRIYRREIARALRRLADTRRDEQKTVHAVRTHCKKIRSTLRLARKAVGDETYHRENRRFRDAARPLARLRDTGVRLKTLHKLDKGDFPAVRKALEDDYRAARRELLQKHAFGTIATLMEKAQLRLEHWKITGGEKTLCHGLRLVYKKGHRAKKQAVQNPTTPNLHEWRKQAKYLWYALEILDAPKPLHKQYKRLAQLLGDDHDLAMLHRRITADRRLAGHKNVKQLLARIDRRRNLLQKKALKLGKRAYTKPPAAFIKKLAIK